jgi:hypothetical protein
MAIDILLALRARIPTVPRWFLRGASVGSSHSRFTSAEDSEEALLLSYPPIGRLDEMILCCHIQKEQERPYIPGFKKPRLYGPQG